jgi:hypothetical protein
VSGEMGPGGGCTPVRPGAGRRVGGTRSARSATGAAAGGGEEVERRRGAMHGREGARRKGPTRRLDPSHNPLTCEVSSQFGPVQLQTTGLYLYWVNNELVPDPAAQFTEAHHLCA